MRLVPIFRTIYYESDQQINGKSWQQPDSTSLFELIILLSVRLITDMSPYKTKSLYSFQIAKNTLEGGTVSGQCRSVLVLLETEDS